MDQMVLVLNADYRPLNVCRMRRALGLTFQGKAEVVELDSVVIRTVSTAFEAPSVIRIRRHVKRPLRRLSVTRKSLFARDGYQCQYCGLKTTKLTLDHVIPRRLGGKSTWENLVSACRQCNGKKAGKTLQEARMSLIKPPEAPRYIPPFAMSKYYMGDYPRNWAKYL